MPEIVHINVSLQNKCTDQAWFMVERFESIKDLKTQIDNFELKLFFAKPA